MRKIVSVIAGYQHLVKVATISEAIARRGLLHLLLDTGAAESEHGRALLADLTISTPRSALPLETFGSTSRARPDGERLSKLTAALAAMDAAVVLVYGDLAGSVEAAVAAKALDLPVVHVEAGRRSFDPGDPEEGNRVELDSIGDLLLCPSLLAHENLRANGGRQATAVVGSTAVEVVVRAAGPAVRETRSPRPVVLAAWHRSDTLADEGRLAVVLEVLADLSERDVITRLVTYGSSYLSSWAVQLSRRQIRHCDLLSFPEYVTTLTSVDCVLTDSTGLQDDAYALGVPTVTMRTHTHCIEALTGGSNVLVGFDPDRAMESVAAALHQRNGLPLGDALVHEGAGDRVAESVAGIVGSIR